MAQETYRMPPDGWVCFHCGERFKTVGGARVHFGRRPSSTAGCLIKVGEARGLLMEVRRLEAELRELIDNACRVCDQTLLSKRALANHKRLTVAFACRVGLAAGWQAQVDLSASSVTFFGPAAWNMKRHHEV